jgi:hypothetical protein
MEKVYMTINTIIIKYSLIFIGGELRRSPEIKRRSNKSNFGKEIYSNIKAEIWINNFIIYF